MSEESTPTPLPKKRVKLPVLVFLLVVLAGSGFFGMKMKSGASRAVVRASRDAPEPLGEFLLNLNSSTNVYLRAEISLRFREGFKKEALAASKDAIKDAITTILRGKTPQEIRADQTASLKRQLASAINAILILNGSPDDRAAFEGDGPTANAKEGWDSASGPVLNVYFTSFATQ